MEIIAPTLCLRLNKDGCLRLVDAAGAVLRACHGALWITQAGDAVDHVLEAGSSLKLDRNGVSLVCAVTDAELRVESAQMHQTHAVAVGSCARSLIGRFVAGGL
jgi:predicted xylose isomerase-like sugar epimerase